MTLIVCFVIVPVSYTHLDVYKRQVMDYAMERICFYLDKRAKGRLEIDCIMYSNEFGELAKRDVYKRQGENR